MHEVIGGYTRGRVLPGGGQWVGAAIINGERQVQRLSMTAELGAVDVGRSPSGELLFVLPLESPGNAKLPATLEAGTYPRFFDPVPQRQLATEASAQPRPSATVWSRVRDVSAYLESLRGQIAQPSRRIVIVSIIVGVIIVGVTSLLSRTSGEHPQAAATSLPSLSALPETAMSDPVGASIAFAAAGELPALGDISGLPRSAFTAVVTSRSGDIVLVDVYASKPSGQKTFATVLLQKSGTQWRMREVFDARG
jgi:hypothetical protein